MTGRMREWWERAVHVLRGHRPDAELQAEFAAHIGMAIEENLRKGMSPEEARRAAAIQFGGGLSATERVIDQRGLPWLESFEVGTGAQHRVYTVVGVVGDTKHTSIRQQVPRFFYIPTGQPREHLGRLSLAVRTAGNPARYVAAVEREARALGPDILVTEVMTLRQQVDASSQITWNRKLWNSVPKV